MAAFILTSLSVLLALLVILCVLTPIYVLAILLRRLFSDASLPSNLQWVGTENRTGPLGRAKANLSSVLNLRDLLDEGYHRYSKNDKIYVLPYYINGPQVVLPTSQIGWLLEQPDDVLSQEAVNRQFLQADYTFLHANKVKDPVHPEVIQHQLTKKIGTFTDDLVDEINISLEDNWGLDAEWHEVNVYDTMLDVVTRLSVRVFLGLPLCRDKIFLKVCGSFIRKVALAAAGISLFPSLLQPFVAPFFTFYDRIQYWRCSRFLMPIIHERLDRMRNLEKSAESQPPNDYVQWALDHALSKPVINPAELDISLISIRFSVLTFAAVQSSVITLTNALFDLAASPHGTASLDRMRDEVAFETASTDKKQTPWSKPMLSRMTHVDSALRESLRLSGFIERGVMKMVVAPQGVTLPDGSHIPCGTKVGISGYSVHHDEENYPNAMKYDAFRFVESKERDKRVIPQGLVNTSESFLGFSHGRHACPGRFFAANQLKIALGHIALLYEIEPIPERPANKWFFGHIAPPLNDKLRVRRRRF
ncbi:cytochrome P450 [Xylariaceae sp. FL0016]|nr:cytochrome P450 [Xylariaceae sp. FL0016]